MRIIGNHPFFIFLYSRGGIPMDLAEEAGEVVSVFDADLIADLVHLHVRKV